MPRGSRIPTHSPRRVALLRSVLRPLYRTILRLEVEGAERVPPEGACIFVFNHLSNFDPHLLYTLVRRPDATGLVAAGYRDRALARWMVEAGGGMWLRSSGRGWVGTRTAGGRNWARTAGSSGPGTVLPQLPRQPRASLRAVIMATSGLVPRARAAQEVRERAG